MIACSTYAADKVIDSSSANDQVETKFLMILFPIVENISWPQSSFFKNQMLISWFELFKPIQFKADNSGDLPIDSFFVCLTMFAMSKQEIKVNSNMPI